MPTPRLKIVKNYKQEKCYLSNYDVVDTQVSRLYDSDGSIFGYNEQALGQFVQKRINSFHSPALIHNVALLVSRFFEANMNNLAAQIIGLEPNWQGLIKKYFDFFDQIFFKGHLTDLGTRFQLHFVPDGMTTPFGREDGLQGESIIYSYDGEGDYISPHNAKIVIYIYQRKDVDGVHRLRHYLGTLLHEMIHAFFLIFACRCDQCYITNNERTGHGRWWQKTAMAMEDLVRERLKLNVDLGRTDAYALECIGERGDTFEHLPIDEDFIKQLELNYIEVAGARHHRIMQKDGLPKDSAELRRIY